MLEQVLAKQVGGALVPEKVSLKAGIVVGVVSWLILIDGKVGITIVFPVEQPAVTTIVNSKLDDSWITEGKSESEQKISTGYVPAKSVVSDRTVNN